MKFDDIIENYENKAKQSSKSIDRMEKYNAEEYQQIADWIKELKAFREFIKYFDEKSDFDIIHNDEYGEYQPSRYSLKGIFENFLESQKQLI